MLSKNLYELCIFLTTPYEYLNSINNNMTILPPFIYEDIFCRKLFFSKWSKKFNYVFNNFKFTYSYDILAQNSNFIKIKLNLNCISTIENNQKNISSGCIYEYIIILEHFHNKFKLQLLLEHEENPCLYNSLLNTNLDQIPSLSFHNDKNSWLNKLSSLESLYTTFTESICSQSKNNIKRNDSNFNIAESCSYAETFALNPNPKYKYFDNIGGDCTNFISQILFAGGLKQNNSWKPYTMPWIRVEDIYLYLTRNKIAIHLPKISLSRGCIIQFYTPEIGRYFHNGFITYELENNDFLYCCHSYNKLNYPLSQIYPHKYPVLRALKII